MKEVKVDRRVRKTKKLYENALIELLKTKDINKITVTDLSEKVDLNRGTFYIHYDNIYDLFESIQIRIIQEVTAIAGNQSGENSSVFFEEGFTSIVKALEYIQENRMIFKILLNEQGNLLFLSKLKKMFSEKLLHSLIYVSSDVEKKYTNLFSSFFISGCTGIVQEWLNNDSDISVFELATVILTMLKTGTAHYQ